ncbi:hemicentin-1-like [Nematostella vectensis]|uniref:hemicentin-1-like n=1 Tax=Nematostella vectensis TaxID=45351 RepID=UPI00207784A9|nr:hemicentin-1-like [Nematostella vectensis]
MGRNESLEEVKKSLAIWTNSLSTSFTTARTRQLGHTGYTTWTSWTPYCNWQCQRVRQRFCVGVGDSKAAMARYCPGADSDGLQTDTKDGRSMLAGGTGDPGELVSQCGTGTRTRKRECDNPLGTKCPGSDNDTSKCTKGRCNAGYPYHGLLRHSIRWQHRKMANRGWAVSLENRIVLLESRPQRRPYRGNGR